MGRRAGQRVKNYLIYLAVSAAISLLRLTPRRLVGILGVVLGTLAWLLAGRERRRALANVGAALPELDGSARRTLVRRVFVNFGRGALECAVLPRLEVRPSVAGSVVRFAPGARETLEAALEQGSGVIFVTGHIGNWELLGAAVSAIAPVAVLAKPSYDPRFTRMIEAFRRASGVESIDVTVPGHLRRALAAVRGGKVLGVLLDQPVAEGPTVPFFGRPAPTSVLPARLAQRSGAVLVVGHLRRCGRGMRHLVMVRRVPVTSGDGASDVLRLTRLLTEELEQAVRDAPEQWAWTLARWRSAGAGDLSS